jgi:hypothetical protein
MKRKNILKKFTEFKNCCTFALPLLVQHVVRFAFGSLFKGSNFTNDNTPPMPLHDAHLGGLLFF